VSAPVALRLSNLTRNRRTICNQLTCDVSVAGWGTQGDLQRLLSQEASLKQQVAAVQERIASMERTRASDKAFLQVGITATCSTECTKPHVLEEAAASSCPGYQLFVWLQIAAAVSPLWLRCQFQKFVYHRVS